MAEDRVLTCVECGMEFVYAASEQELHQSLGYKNEPKRCRPCRESRKARTAPSRAREFTTAPCASCGRDASVPFRPDPTRPVYCSDCFEKRRASPGV